LKGNVVDGEGCAIGKIGKRARNRRIGQRIVDLGAELDRGPTRRPSVRARRQCPTDGALTCPASHSRIRLWDRFSLLLAGATIDPKSVVPWAIGALLLGGGGLWLWREARHVRAAWDSVMEEIKASAARP
jgi:hypothetical protein